MTTPFNPHIKLYPNTRRAWLHSSTKVIGSVIMYAMTCTRPDFAFTMDQLSRFTSIPSNLHWLAVKRVMRYLRHNMDYGIVYSGYPTILEGFTGAS